MRKKQQALHLQDAFETLSEIAEIEIERDIGITEPHDLSKTNSHYSRTPIYWPLDSSIEETIQTVQKTFKTILGYLRKEYKRPIKKSPINNDTIKDLMLVVGEATYKLDKCSQLFYHTKIPKVSNLKEYIDLQNFYKYQIRKIPIRKIPSPQKSLNSRSKLSLEDAKSDRYYELFFLRNSKGERFYNKSLMKDIKLACDFEEHFGEYSGEDPLLRIKFWEEKLLQVTAQNILHKSRLPLEEFYEKANEYRHIAIVTTINKAITALSMSANPRNLLRNNPFKNCHSYFSDFLGFLRQALNDKFYTGINYLSKANLDEFQYIIIELLHSICYTIYTHNRGDKELIAITKNLLAKNDLHKQQKKYYNNYEHMLDDYQGMVESFSKHPNGPLFKVLDLFNNPIPKAFDPLLDENIPGKLFNIEIKNKIIEYIRMPSPTIQTSIDRAKISPEFIGFLRHKTIKSKPRHHLIINLQDRTGWQEQARCHAIESLGNNSDFKNTLTVISISKNSDFYYQNNHYKDQSSADEFKKTIYQNVSDENTGFYFPQNIKEHLFQGFTRSLIDRIHYIFFDKKGSLTQHERQNFIEIFYFFLTIKLLEIVQPSSFSFCCKDGVDVSGAAIGMFFTMLQIISSDDFSNEKLGELEAIIYGIPLIIRERAMLPEILERLLNTIENFTHRKDKRKSTKEILQRELKGLFDDKIFSTHLIKPQWALF